MTGHNEDQTASRFYEVHLRLTCGVEATSDEEAADIALEAAAWIGSEDERFSLRESVVE